ncbi:uncharacterized protein LOC143039156 [Oratosquilla oratoria]|uniref:uncharacterized protein LOC143039156 n=1 Tax=Oratosquilla oratoria TaxID=337810 RepID=UPI003F75AF53
MTTSPKHVSEEFTEDTKTSPRKRALSSHPVSTDHHLEPLSKKVCTDVEESLCPLDTPLESQDCLHFLGEGSYGSVYLIENDRTNAYYAFKVSEISGEYALEAVNKEIRALSNLRGHSNILSLFEFIMDGEIAGLVLEYVPFTLDHIISFRQKERHLPSMWLKSLLSDLLHGVAHIHAKGFVHFDLKPSILLVTQNGVLKIADFGMAELQSDSPYELEKMTELYRPPEGCLRKHLLGTKSDMWSVGVIIIEVITGDVVFANAQGRLRAEDLAWAYGCKGSLSLLSRMLIQKNSPSPELTGDIKVHFSSALLSLTEDLLRCNPKDRLTAQAALEHNGQRGYIVDPIGKRVRLLLRFESSFWDTVCFQNPARYKVTKFLTCKNRCIS